MVFRSRIKVISLLLALMQATILVLAINMRGSATWTIVLLAALAMFLSFRTWRRMSSSRKTLHHLIKLTARWPLVLVLVCVAASKFYTDTRLHPAYFTDDIIPCHGAWDVAFLGLAHSPTLWQKIGATPDKPLDRTGVEFTVAYLQQHRFLRNRSRTRFSMDRYLQVPDVRQHHAKGVLVSCDQ